MELCYLDTGIFVTPLLKNQPAVVVERCHGWLERAAAGEIRAVTSYLTWDEVAYVAGKAGRAGYDRFKAQEAGRRLLALPSLIFVDVDESIVGEAQRLIEISGHRPRDCIHASSALRHAGGRLITLDGGFLKDLPGLHVTVVGAESAP